MFWLISYKRHYEHTLSSTLYTAFFLAAPYKDSLSACFLNVSVYWHHTEPWNLEPLALNSSQLSFLYLFCLGKNRLLAQRVFLRLDLFLFFISGGHFQQLSCRGKSASARKERNLLYAGEEGGRQSCEGFQVWCCNVTISCALTCWHAFKLNILQNI